MASPEQAEERRVAWNDNREFKPFFDGDRVEFYVTPEVIAFVAAIGGSLDTHGDFKLQDDRPKWWGPNASDE